jgi:hypothetical protein
MIQMLKSCDVATRPCEAWHDILLDWIGDAGEDDGDGMGLLLQDGKRPSTDNQDRVRLEVDELGRMRAHPIHIVRGPALINS